MNNNQSLKKALASCLDAVEQKIDELLPQEFSDSKLLESMRYSALSSGKRIRPFLLISSAQIFDLPIQASINAAVAIELIHTYSLIHDDLPAMDNDDFRRGIPTNHKKFNEATAILAGDALLTYAFEILAMPQTHANSLVRCELISKIAKASGFLGMAGGQMIDLEKSSAKISEAELMKLHQLKTGEIFAVAAESAAIIGGANEFERKALRSFALDFGLAFQIKDDIEDHYKKSKIGKFESINFVSILGIDHTTKRLNELRKSAIQHLEIFGERSSLLKELVNFTLMN